MRGRTVADAMLTTVKLTDATTTAHDLRRLFADPHVHAAVVVAGGRLLGVVDAGDLDGPLPGGTLAVHLARRDGRTVAPDAGLEDTLAAMLASGRRRLAVACRDGVFHGLLCLKRSRTGFCTDRDVRARALVPTEVRQRDPTRPMAARAGWRVVTSAPEPMPCASGTRAAAVSRSSA